jgi:predicted MFS family arabinose efflux permease
VSERDWGSWTLLVGAIVLGASLAAYEIAPASVTPLLRDSLGVGPSAAGLVVGVMFGTAVVASLPAGIVLDRTDSRQAIVVATGGLLVAGVWGYQAATAGAFVSLLASRVLGGLAFTVVWNASIDVVGRSFALDRQATAVATFTASGPLGFALGQGASPFVAEWLGWPAIFPVFAGLAVVGLVPFWVASRGRGRATDDPTPDLADFGRVLTHRGVVTVCLLGFLGFWMYLFVNSWAPSYLEGELALSLAVSGLVTAMFPAIGALSRVSGGVLSDRVFDGRRRPVMLLAFVVSTPIVAGFTLLRGVPVVVGALLVAGLAIQLSLGLAFAYVRELVEPSVAATAVAFLTSVALAGAFLSPIVGGAVIDAAGYPAAFALAGVLGLVGVVLAWFAPETS